MARHYAEAIGAIDVVHLMAYDAQGKHSTLEFAKSDIDRLVKKGVPLEKICLGVPFYGTQDFESFASDDLWRDRETVSSLRPM